MAVEVFYFYRIVIPWTVRRLWYSGRGIRWVFRFSGPGSSASRYDVSLFLPEGLTCCTQCCSRNDWSKQTIRYWRSHCAQTLERKWVSKSAWLRGSWLQADVGYCREKWTKRRIRWVTRKGKRSSFELPSGWLTLEEASRLPLPDTSWMDQPWPRSKFTKLLE